MNDVIKNKFKGILVKAALKELAKDDNITFQQLCKNISDGETSPEFIRDMLKEAGFKFTKSMKITVEFEVRGCKGCPYSDTGRDYGNDGRDGKDVYICRKDVYGKYNSGYWDGLSKIPNVTPQDCPFNK